MAFSDVRVGSEVRVCNNLQVPSAYRFPVRLTNLTMRQSAHGLAGVRNLLGIRWASSCSQIGPWFPDRSTKPAQEIFVRDGESRLGGRSLRQGTPMLAHVATARPRRRTTRPT